MKEKFAFSVESCFVIVCPIIFSSSTGWLHFWKMFHLLVQNFCFWQQKMSWVILLTNNILWSVSLKIWTADTTPVDRIKSPQSGCPKPIVSYSNKVTEWILAPDVKVYRFPRQPRNVVEAVRNINGGIWPLHLQARGGLKTNLLNG